MKAILLALCVATAARGAEPVFDAPEPPPAVYGPLVWLHAGVATHGWWSTDKAIQDVRLKLEQRQAQVDYLTDRATKECTDATNAETKKVLGAAPTLWVGVGLALVVGVAGGFYLGRR